MTSSPPLKNALDTSVEDLAGEIQTALAETGAGGTTQALEKTLGHIMSAVTNVQDAINDTKETTYPGWFATDKSPPPPQS